MMDSSGVFLEYLQLEALPCPFQFVYSLARKESERELIDSHGNQYPLIHSFSPMLI
jgi:hypothetical protein